MVDIFNRTTADNEIRPHLKDRRYELLDIRRAVLIISVGIHNDVRASFEAGIHSSAKRVREPLVAWNRNDVIDTALLGYCDRAIRAPIVND
jgi:hypothetical protein